jgi:hypothetical protein
LNWIAPQSTRISRKNLLLSIEFSNLGLAEFFSMPVSLIAPKTLTMQESAATAIKLIGEFGCEFLCERERIFSGTFSFVVEFLKTLS